MVKLKKKGVHEVLDKERTSVRCETVFYLVHGGACPMQYKESNDKNDRV